MVSMEKVKPESRKPGRNETSMPIWYACTCEREPAEIQLPKNSAHNTDRQVETASTTKLPRNGTVKIVIATVTEIAESTSPTRKYASILPSTISVGRSGVESTCSMVPISHSRRTHAPAVQQFGPHPRRVVLHHAFRIPHGNRSRLRIAAIHQQLHCPFPRRQVPAEPARDHDPDQHFACVDPPLDRLVVVHESGDLEIARALKLPDHFAAGRGPVLVVDQRLNVVDIQAQRISVEQQHHHRHRQRHRQAARVARDVVQLLDEHGPQPPVAHAAFLSSVSITATNTSSMEGSISSRRRTLIPLASSAVRIFRLPASTSSTVTCNPPPNTATSRTPSSPSSARMVSSGSVASRLSSVW